MERLSRFRRHKKEKATPAAPATSTGAPAVPSADGQSSGTRTPSPASQSLPLPPPPSRDKPSRSPFRGLHLRSSKRARESPPGSAPRSPNPGLLAPDGHNGQMPSPLSSSLPSQRSTDNTASTMLGGAMRIPDFLDLTDQRIEQKFQDIIWLERERLMSSHANPSREFRFARVPSASHIRSLDRYTNIQPWDNNRVRLRVPTGHVDYINASPVALPAPAGDDGPADRYIAMQGPKRQTADHVWRMVVEETRSPAVVVMLTETHEASVEKCFPYFPRDAGGPPLEVNERDEFGDGFRATVTCEGLEETPAGEAIELRRLLVRVHKPRARQANGTNGVSTPAETGLHDETGDGDVEMRSPAAATRRDDVDVPMKSPTVVIPPQTLVVPATSGATTPTTPTSISGAAVEYESEHTVYHFLYKKWPDFGVPALEDLDSFFTLMRLSRARNAAPDNPRIVHCSAGVGRSGTFIALEHLTRALDAGTLSPLQAGANGGGGPGERAPGKSAGVSSEEEEDDDEEGEEEEDVVFATVDALREQRRTMVQAEAQFLFIYRVLRKLWVDRYGDPGAGGGSSPATATATAGTNGRGGVGGSDEPAAKRQEFDPFVT